MPAVTRRMLRMRAKQLEDTESKMADLSPETKGTPKFTLFPKLPAELRVKSWKLASQHERVVQIRTFRVLGKPKHSWSDTPPPSVLGSCRESPHEGLKYYKVLRVMSDARTLGRVKVIYIHSVVKDLRGRGQSANTQNLPQLPA
jgi:hypothetical protein